ncbi:MAG: hypothetical protein RLZZ165_687, partial [Bacteroidota bacterium]
MEAPDTEDTGNPRIPPENDAPSPGDGEETLLSYYAGGVLDFPPLPGGDGGGGAEAQEAGETLSGRMVKGAGIALGLA